MGLDSKVDRPRQRRTRGEPSRWPLRAQGEEGRGRGKRKEGRDEVEAKKKGGMDLEGEEEKTASTTVLLPALARREEADAIGVLVGDHCEVKGGFGRVGSGRWGAKEQKSRRAQERSSGR
jgi:hypothetical protein